MEAALLMGMLLAFFVVSLVLLSQKGLFIDDSMHMPAGYSYLLTHDYRLNQEHPPLIKLLSGLGLWKLHPYFPFESPGWQQAATPGDPEDGMERIEEAFFESNAKQFEQIAFYGRLPILVIPLLLLLAVWWITRRLFGPVPALIAVFLIATEPNIVGNAIVVQNDIAAALVLLLFVIAVKKFMTDTRVTGASVLGGALGLALVTKYSLIVLVPVSCAIVIAWAICRLIRKRSSLFPFAAIVGAGFISAVVEFGLKRGRHLGVALAAIALVPGLVIAVSAFPNYLTYFSPIAGGAARGWQTLSDSNVETGQEVKPLARYLKHHGENRVTGIMVGGEFLKFYGIQADDFPGWYDDDDADEVSGEDSREGADEDRETEPIKTEYVAIGAWYLSEIDLSGKQKEIIDIYRQQKPEVMVGNSIFVFRRQQ